MFCYQQSKRRRILFAEKSHSRRKASFSSSFLFCTTERNPFLLLEDLDPSSSATSPSPSSSSSSSSPSLSSSSSLPSPSSLSSLPSPSSVNILILQRICSDLIGNAKEMVVKVKRETLEACMICPLCHKLLKDATTISLCLHTFCRKCIHEKLSDEEMDCCPVCNIDLGCLPVEKLRPDHNLQDIRSKIFPVKRKKNNGQKIKFGDDEDGNALPSGPVKRRRQRPAGQKRAAASEMSASAQVMLDATVNRCNRKNSPIWFSLVASEDQDGTLPVSFIQKYPVKKLNLAHVNASDTVFAPPISHSHPPQQTQTQTMHPVTVTEAETDDEDSIPLSLILRKSKQSTTFQIPPLKPSIFVYPSTSNIPQPDKPQTLTPEPTTITERISTSEPNPETEISQSPLEQLQEFIQTMLSESSSDDSQSPSPVSPTYETPLAVIYNTTDSATVTSAEKLPDETEVVSEPEPFSPFLPIVPYSPIVISLPPVPPEPSVTITKIILSSPNPIPPNPMEQTLQNYLTNFQQEVEMVKKMEYELRIEVVTIACLENYWNEWNSKELHIQFIADWYESHRHRQSNINRRLKLAASRRSPPPSPLAEWIKSPTLQLTAPPPSSQVATSASTSTNAPDKDDYVFVSKETFKNLLEKYKKIEAFMETFTRRIDELVRKQDELARNQEAIRNSQEEIKELLLFFP